MQGIIHALNKLVTSQQEPPTHLAIIFDALLGVIRARRSTPILQHKAVPAFGKGILQTAADALIRLRS